MKKFIVYFHGYQSSPNSNKVNQLKLAFPEDYVYSFAADIDPEIAIKEVGDKIDSTLLNHLNEKIDVIFIGTSLGSWLAAKLGNVYAVNCILINPVLNPSESLKKYNVAETIRNKYTQLIIDPRSGYFLAKNDEVIDHTELMKLLTENNIKFYIDEQATHRYNGISFTKVIEKINEYC